MLFLLFIFEMVADLEDPHCVKDTYIRVRILRLVIEMSNIFQFQYIQTWTERNSGSGATILFNGNFQRSSGKIIYSSKLLKEGLESEI